MSKITAKLLITSIALVILIGVGIAKPIYAAKFNLRMHSFIPPVANPAKTWLIPWAKKINKESGGQINVKTFWKMQLGGKPQALLDQVRGYKGHLNY